MITSRQEPSPVYSRAIWLAGSFFFFLAACGDPSVPSVAERCFALEVGDWSWVSHEDEAIPDDEAPPEISRLIPSVLALSSEPGHDVSGEPVDADSPDRRIDGLEWRAPSPVRAYREVWRLEDDRLSMEWSSGFVVYWGELQWQEPRQVWEGTLSEGTDYHWAVGGWTSTMLLRPIDCPPD